MSDLASADQGAAVPSRSRPVMQPSMVLMAVGVIAGAVGIAGFWLNFFSAGSSSLSSGGSGWFDLVPIFIGLSTVALFIPRYGRMFSGLSLISLGIAFGIRGLISSLGKGLGGSGSIGYGAGFWMIVLGAGVLALAWLAILATARRTAVAPTG